jgi:hypothetical protein
MVVVSDVEVMVVAVSGEDVASTFNFVSLFANKIKYVNENM